MRLLVPLLALTLAACTTPEVLAPEARVLTVEARQAIEECHATARADDTLVLFEAVNCLPGRVVLLQVHASWGVVMDGGVMGDAHPVEWYPRPGEFTAIEVETGRVIASISNP